MAHPQFRRSQFRRFWIVLLCVACFEAGLWAQAATQRLSLTLAMVAGAEKLLGLQFAPKKRALMLEDLNERRRSYDSIRKVALANDIPPALLFNPIPQGVRWESARRAFRPSRPGNVDLPANLNDVAFYSVGQLAELLRSRRLTSERLTRLYLDRLKRYGGKLECVITLTEELALEQARRADVEIAAGRYRGPLHGIPYGAKDLLATKGIRTTWGSVPFRDRVINEDATVIKRLEQAGAVLLAKLTLGELAWGDVWYGGKTRNPWNLQEGSSGSSAGPGAATAAGLVAFSIGSETWGSIVSPSTRCGVSGLRPTYGRVSRKGAMTLSWSMDKIGPMCRSAEDCALVLNAICGPDRDDPTTYDVPFGYDFEVDLRQLRVGYLKSDFDKEKDSDETKNESRLVTSWQNDQASLAALRSLGAQLIPIELPRLPISDLAFILGAEAAAVFDDLTRSGKDDLLRRQVKNAWPNVLRASRFIPAVEYLQANRIRYLLVQEMARIMEKVDLYVAPSLVGDNLLLTNLTGHPCVIVPNGFTKAGTPTSISFIGKLFDEGTVLAVAKKYQDATGFHLKHPSLAE